MKIVHVVYSLEMGGAEVLVGQLCRIQRANGHDVSVFAYAMIGVVGEGLIADGFEVYVPGVAHPLRTMLRYWKRLRRAKPDVVHCHNVAPTTHAALSARLAGVPCVLSTRHGLEVRRYPPLEELQHALMSCCCNWVVGICEVTCQNLRRKLLARKRRIVRVYNGSAPVERVNTGGLETRGFTLVFIGRLAPEKDLGTLIRAVGLARDAVPGLRFWIVGDGRVRAEWEALVAQLGVGEQVRFWGQRTDTPQFFSAANAFVMSSISEGLPMSLLQAMSIGVPAIVTDVGGMGEVLRLTGAGLLVPAGDAAAMADAIVRLAGDAELRAECSAAAVAGYRSQFTLERMDAEYMRLYRSRVPPAGAT